MIRLIGALLVAMPLIAANWWLILEPPAAADVKSLQLHAQQQQSAISSWLSSQGIKHQRFWISNRILLLNPTSKQLDSLRRAGYRLEPERTHQIPRPKVKPAPASSSAIEPNISLIRAPELWARGLTGKGALVALIDTGIAANHPALAHAWSGLWSDPANICGGSPCDNVGHGTHVAGIIAGTDGIGVAPEAKLAACKGCESFSCTEGSLLSCAQWVLELKPRPIAVNNSWGGLGDDWFHDAIRAWRAARIIPVVAAGNNGPSCGSTTVPGYYAESLTVGAIDNAGSIASFSGRGPAETTKPDLVAPGVNIKSAYPTGYAQLSGTSMATPHVTGVIALLALMTTDLERIPAAMIQTAIRQSDRSCGGPDPPNNVYGWGRIDALRAYDELRRQPDQPPTIEIIEPIDGTRFRCGELIRLTARAEDPEEGDLSAGILWWSTYPFWRGARAELIGATGRGCELGWHIVRAEVRDSAGNAATAIVKFEVVK